MTDQQAPEQIARQVREQTLLLVLSTRPAADGEALARALRDLPLQLVSLPASEPRLRPWSETLRQQLNQPADIWFFPSRHAVAVLDYLAPEQRRGINAACPGPGTVRALGDYDVATVIAPPHQHTSEALLAMPALQAVAGKRVRVLNAPGGRDAVAETLRQRGAQVHNVTVYERVPVTPAPAVLARLEQAAGAWLSVVTSGQGLQHLQRHLPPPLWRKVQRATMVVPSARVAELARAAGVARVDCVAPPDNTHLAAYIRAGFDHLTMQPAE